MDFKIGDLVAHKNASNLIMEIVEISKSQGYACHARVNKDGTGRYGVGYIFRNMPFAFLRLQEPKFKSHMRTTIFK